MKKVILSSVLAAFGLCAFAQTDSTAAATPTQHRAPVVIEEEEETAEAPASLKYKAGPERFGLEAGISFGGANSIGLEGGRLLGLYSLNEEWTVRLGFGLTTNKTYARTEATVLGVTGDDKATQLTTSFDLYPGVQYAFKGTDRLEPYVGAELIFGFDKTKVKTSEKVGGDEVLKTKDAHTDLHFGLNGFAGFDFYVAKDLYIGAEVGFGFLTTPKHRTTSFVDDKATPANNVATDTWDTGDNTVRNHTTDTRVLVNPRIRLGWKF